MSAEPVKSWTKRTARRDLFFDCLFCLLILAEYCLVLFLHQEGYTTQAFNAIAQFLVSVLIGVLAIVRFYKRPVRYEPFHSSAFRLRGMLPLLVFMGGLLLLGGMLPVLFRKFPIGAHISDIIPSIQVEVRRFLSGSVVYRPITEWGYFLQVTYLPMQWMPYCLAPWLGLDERWIAFSIWGLAAALCVIRSVNRASAYRGYVTAILLLLAGFMIRRFDEGILGMTVELMVAGYYMLMITGLNQRMLLFRGLFIAFCLLSRFSLVLWLPLWALTEFTSGNRKDLCKTMGVIAGFVLLVYVIPFLSRDWSAFYKSYSYYNTSALWEWTHLNQFHQPFHLFQGLGFAWLFYERLPAYSVADRIRSLQKVHLALCLCIPLLLYVWYWFQRRQIHYRIFLMGSFKIYLSVFLAFIQVPYVYLMITGCFVSVAILVELWRYVPFVEQAPGALPPGLPAPEALAEVPQ